MIQEVDIKAIKENLTKKIPQMDGQKVLVIGDIGLDEYVMGNVHRISPEAPVPVLEVKEEFFKLGLTTNVAQNIKAMGGEPLLVSIIGEDMAGEKICQLLKENEISAEHLIRDAKRPTTRKTRMMSEMHHMVRVDYEFKHEISTKIEEEVLKKFQELLSHVAVVVLQDYAKGLLSKSLSLKLLAMANKEGKKVFVDPHSSKKPEIYQGAFLMTPNLKEAMALVKSNLDMDLIKDEDIIDLGHQLQALSSSPAMIVTRSKDGMSFFEGEKVRHVPTFAKQVYDVTGAGDTVISAIALAHAAGLSLEEACVFANFSAGLVVEKVGAVAAKQEEILSYMNSY